MSMEQFLADNFPELGEDKIEEITNKFEDYDEDDYDNEYGYEDDYDNEELDWNALEIEVELEETTH